MPHPEQWPQNPTTSASEESEAEAKMVKEVMAIAIDETDEFDESQGRRNLRTTLRVCVWIRRLVQNCRRHPKIVGPIMTDEIEQELKWWILREQDRAKNNPKYEED